MRVMEEPLPSDPKTNFLYVWMYVFDRYSVETSKLQANYFLQEGSI